MHTHSQVRPSTVTAVIKIPRYYHTYLPISLCNKEPSSEGIWSQDFIWKFNRRGPVQPVWWQSDKYSTDSSSLFTARLQCARTEYVVQEKVSRDIPVDQLLIICSPRSRDRDVDKFLFPTSENVPCEPRLIKKNTFSASHEGSSNRRDIMFYINPTRRALTSLAPHVQHSRSLRALSKSGDCTHLHIHVYSIEPLWYHPRPWSKSIFLSLSCYWVPTYVIALPLTRGRWT